MHHSNVPWTLQRGDFDEAVVVARPAGHRISVIIPARNEAATIGAVIDAVLAIDGIVDELVVVDDASNDDTATVARHHGAMVHTLTGRAGKGGALTAGVAATTGELVVFLDADVTSTTPDYVARMVQPLIVRPDIHLVKPYYERPLHHLPNGGGRVNELAARPILSLLSPGLGEIRQPLAGESAIRRATLDQLELAAFYGIEIALLIDVAQMWGIGAIAQVDLGVRRHRNRPLDELRPMAVQVLKTAMSRFGVELPSS